jgi:chromate reductase
MKIIAIGGSNSKKSINRALANFVAQQFDGATVLSYDISTVEIPMYSIDKEQELGIPAEVNHFASLIDETDLIVLSLAENNGTFNVGLKNLLDWTSRIKDRKTFNGKPMLLMATSPGARGGETVLGIAASIFPYVGADVKATFSVPNFYQNFDFENGINNEELLTELKSVIELVKSGLQ